MGWNRFLRLGRAEHEAMLPRIESDPRFEAIKQHDQAAMARAACQIAVSESGLVGERVADALGALEREAPDTRLAASMRELADILDEQAWDAHEAGGDDGEVFFRRSRAASALCFALSGEPGEAVYEAAFALPRPEQLVERLRM